MIGDLRAEADRRMELKGGYASTRALSPDYQFVGMVGEAEFSRVFKLPRDTEEYVGGDKGIDFTLKLLVGGRARDYTLDVKTYRCDRNLLVEAAKVRADIYVLAHYLDSTQKARLLGWEWASKIRTYAPRDSGRGIINHEVPKRLLRPMEELGALRVR